MTLLLGEWGWGGGNITQRRFSRCISEALKMSTRLKIKRQADTYWNMLGVLSKARLLKMRWTFKAVEETERKNNSNNVKSASQIQHATCRGKVQKLVQTS